MPGEDDTPMAATGGVVSPTSEPATAHAAFAMWRLRRARLSMPAPEWLLVAAIILSLAYYYAIPSPLLSLPGLLAFIILAWLRLDLALCLLPLTFPFWFVPRRVAGSVVFPLSEIALAVCVVVAFVQLLWRLTAIYRTQPLTSPRHPPDTVGALPVLPAAADSNAGESVGVSAGRPPAMPVPQNIRDTLSAAFSTTRARLRLAGAPILIGAALLLTGTALGAVIARRPHEALRAFRWEVAEPLLYAALMLIYLRRRHVRLLVAAFLGAALLLAALAVVQVFWLHVTFLPLAQGSRLIPYATPAGTVPRATAFIFGSGNTLGAWMGRAIPLAVALALAPRALPSRLRLLALAVALACVPALLWSDSRGALIAAALACAVVAVLSLPRPRLALGLAAGVTLAALIVLLANRAAVLRALLTGHNSSGEVRTLVWLAAWHMVRDHPLLGIGPDQFLYYYSNLYTSHPYWILYQNGKKTLAWTEPNLAQPHNLFLDLWLSGGVLTLAGFLLILAAFWLACLRTRRPVSMPPLHMGAARGIVGAHGMRPGGVAETERDGSAAMGQGMNSPELQPALRAAAMYGRDTAWRAAVALGLAASVLAGILHGMVDSAYFEPDLALIFWWSVATLIVLRGDRQVDERSPTSYH